METFTITKIKGNDREITEDVVAQEIPFTVILRNKELVTLLCSPFDLEDLVRGFLFTSGLIKGAAEIKNMMIDRERWSCYVDMPKVETEKLIFKRLYTSGCGRGTLFYSVLDIMYKSKVISDFKIKTGSIADLMNDFQKRSEVYLKTGGTHSAALSDGKDILVFREDIGRHNAIDKAVGRALMNNCDFKNTLLITSGRISSEVLFKVRKGGIPMVVSKSAPTNQAVKLAREMDITVIGFARGTRMNVYSGEKRVNGKE
jgi:FdhD protein